MAKVRTVLGDIEPSQLGPTLSHEHTIVGWMGATLDPDAAFDREAAIAKVTSDLTQIREAHGITGFVDCAPPDLMRDVEFEAEVSRRSGVHIIAATGMYRQGWGIPLYWQLRDVDELEDFFLREVEKGVGETGIRCGVIKIATAGATISPNEEKVLRAAGRVSRRTGVAITTHTDPEGWAETNVGMKQLEVFLSEGADPGRVIIGHACGTPNIRYLLEILERGCFLSYDRVGAVRIMPDEVRAAVIAGLVAAGYASRVMLSHDHQGFWIQRPPKNPLPVTRDFGYIHRTFIPMLQKGGVSDSAIHQMLVDAPQKAFAF